MHLLRGRPFPWSFIIHKSQLLPGDDDVIDCGGSERAILGRAVHLSGP